MPSEIWDATSQDGYNVLIYKGQNPAQALDALVKGPSVIDCGMFAQLSLWFGIRYILGNERFNQCFGRAPFFITQLVYNDIEHSRSPYTGNPLYPFLSYQGKEHASSVTLKHLANTPLYALKHPGGNYGGENVILIDEQYYIFDPQLEKPQGRLETDVLQFLRDAFNAEQASYDNDRLSIYAEKTEKLHPKLGLTYGQLVKAAEELSSTQLTEEDFLTIEQNPLFALTFDVNKLSTWLEHLERKTDDITRYVTQPIHHSQLPEALLSAIPFENRTSMDFSKFRQDTPQQKEMIETSMRFCQRVMAKESQLIVLTGKAGVGKTASAVCAAKELAARGKQVAWISEVMVKGWADQAKTMAELDKSSQAIDSLLALNPDVVFLDDDNLAGFSGQLLLEKIYAWYVENLGKGLFITSNEPIHLKNCYGYKLDQRYHYPPFNHYDTPQYINWHQQTDLVGDSLRSKRDGQSIGAIVSDATWKRNQDRIGVVELIPGFEDDELAEIRKSLIKTNTMGPIYDQLTPVQQQWLHPHNISEHYYNDKRGSHIRPPYLGTYPDKFEKTSCKTIAIELRERNTRFYGKIINEDSINQLIRVLNYAHDQGGRRIILINQTSYSFDELLEKIKTELPSSEKERTWSRLKLLLCETEDTIFRYKDFDGSIEETTPEISPQTMSKPSINGLFSSGPKPSGLSGKLAKDIDRFAQDSI